MTDCIKNQLTKIRFFALDQKRPKKQINNKSMKNNLNKNE